MLALLAANNGNAILETPVTSMIHDQLTNNPLKMGIIEPYRGIIHPFRGIIQPFRGIIKPFRGIIQPSRGIIQPSRGITEPLTFRGIIQPNVRRIFLPNRSSGRNDLHDSAHWEEPECLIVNKERKQRILVQKIVRNTFTKAMPGYHEHVISNPANIRSLNERQSRQCLHFKQVKLYRKRNREPSRVPSKVLKLMKHRKLRSKIKRCLKESVPISSVFFSIATNYKLWIIKVAGRQESFFTNFFGKKFQRESCWTSRCNFNYYPILLYQSFDNKNFNLSEKKLLLSGDVELNPGPVIMHNLLNTRLRRHGLTPLDVGGSGDCFFKSVSHQLYGESSHHLAIRATGVEYLRTNPERFIESYIGTSWLEYLSMQQTWAHNVTIQAVADSMLLNIHVIESRENFAAMTVIQGTSLTLHQRSIYLGHIGELHSVSTLPSLPETSANQIANESSNINTMLNHGCGTDTNERRNT